MNVVFRAATPVPDAVSNAPSACMLCSQNCGLQLTTEHNRITGIAGDPDNPFTRGYKCNKPFRLAHYVDHKQRIARPQKRQPDGSMVDISWDLAIEEIGARLRDTLGQHGPDSLAFLGIGGQGVQMGVFFGLAALLGSGSRWWFNALGQEKTQRALVDQWMVGASGDAMSVAHLDQSAYAIIMGSNPQISQRGVEPSKELRAFAKDPNRTLVVVDPRATETARNADLHVAIRPGTDALFLLGMASVIVAEELHDAEFVASRTNGLEAIRGVLAPVNLDDVVARTGVPRTTVQRIARDFAAASSAAIEMDLGLEQSRFNTLTAWLVRLIAALTGNLGRPGGTIWVTVCSPRIPGALVPSKPSKVAGIPGITLMAPVPMYSPNLFAEEVLRDAPDRIRAAIIDGTNPALSYADTPRTVEALERLDLSVVIEPTTTETTRLADYVLPTPVAYEKWEVSLFPKPFPMLGLQLRPPVLQSPDGPLPEPEIYHRIARAAGIVPEAPRLLKWLARRALRPGWSLLYCAALGALAAVTTLSPRRTVARAVFWSYETLGPTLPSPQLSKIWLMCQGMAWTRRAAVNRARPELAGILDPSAVGNRLFALTLEHPEGVILGLGDEQRNLEENLKHASGRVELAPEPMLAEVARALSSPIEPDPDFPFVLNGGMRTHWTANSNFRDPAWRKGKGPHCAVRMNPDDADRLGVAKGDRVRVRSRSGGVELPVLLDKQVRAGHLHIPNGFGTRYPDPETGELVQTGVGINQLTDAQDRDPFTGCPHHKFVRCREQLT